MIRKKTLVSVVLVFTVLVQINTFAYTIHSTWINNVKYVYLNDVASFYGFTMKRYKKSCTLKSKYSNIVINYNSKLANINGVVTYLSYPSRIKKIGKSWIILISEKDFLLLMDPILRKTVLSRQNVRTVIIDPGHGGKDSGAKGSISKEKNIALEVARRLSAILQKAGFKVILTRNSDKYLTLATRPGLAKKYNGDIFISLHCNATTKKSTTGIETFIYTPSGTESTYGSSPAKYYPINNYDKNNVRLAYEIQEKLNLMKSNDRGLKHSQFKVLRLSTMPAVLVELGFISSPTEENNLNTPNYQYLLAYRIAQGILEYSKAVK